MTGFLENLHAQVQGLATTVAALEARINALNTQAPAATPAAAANPLAGLNGATPPATAAADPFAGIGGTPTPTPAAAVTDEMVMKLVSDNVANEAVKAKMREVLASMGIASLPDTRPDQLPELYQRLSAVVAQNAGAAAPAATPGII